MVDEMPYIEYMTSNSVKLLHLIIIKINGYIEENNGNKYLILVPTAESKDTLKKNKDLRDKIKDLARSKTDRLHNSKLNKSHNYDEK